MEVSWIMKERSGHELAFAVWINENFIYPWNFFNLMLKCATKMQKHFSVDKPRGWRECALRFAEIFALKAVESFEPPCMKNIHEVLSKAECEGISRRACRQMLVTPNMIWINFVGLSWLSGTRKQFIASRLCWSFISWNYPTRKDNKNFHKRCHSGWLVLQ